jgi:hypothetical protein
VRVGDQNTLRIVHVDDARIEHLVLRGFYRSSVLDYLRAARRFSSRQRKWKLSYSRYQLVAGLPDSEEWLRVHLRVTSAYLGRLTSCIQNWRAIQQMKGRQRHANVR